VEQKEHDVVNRVRTNNVGEGAFDRRKAQVQAGIKTRRKADRENTASFKRVAKKEGRPFISK